MRDAFSQYHPIVNFMYFCAVIVFTMFFMHPFLLVLSMVGAFAYSIYLKGMRALKFNFGFVLPVMLLASLINPLFNHRGVTILFYLRDNPITMESIIYGLATGVMLGTMILWFSCYNEIMTSDKFIYLFGRLIPALSLIFSMVLRFVPRFKEQLKIISAAQKCIGRDLSDGKLLEKIKNGIKILSIMVTWALENAIDTSDSMKSRGYGLHGRTAFAIFTMDSRDKLVLIIESIIILTVIIGGCLGVNNIQYFPFVIMEKINLSTGIIFFMYSILCFFPLILNVREDIKWRYLQSKI